MLAGDSIARLGDGEFGIAFGNGNATHAANPKLAKELRGVLRKPAPRCLPAIPTMDPEGPRYGPFWAKSKKRYLALLDMNRVYGSAFVGRAKAAPWVATAEHADAFRGLWAGKKVVAVQCEEGGGLGSLLGRDAKSVTWVICGRTEAYRDIDRLQAECLEADADIAVLVAGPCATVLANRLAKRHLQAIDLGRGVGVILKNASK